VRIHNDPSCKPSSDDGDGDDAELKIPRRECPVVPKDPKTPSSSERRLGRRLIPSLKIDDDDDDDDDAIIMRLFEFEMQGNCGDFVSKCRILWKMLLCFFLLLLQMKIKLLTDLTLLL